MSRKGANNKRCQRRRGLKIGRDCFLKGPGALRTSYRHTLSFAQVQLVPDSYLLLNEPPTASPCWTWTPSPNNLVSRDRGPPLPSSWHTRQTFSQKLALQRLHTWNERPRHSTRLGAYERNDAFSCSLGAQPSQRSVPPRPPERYKT